MNVFSIPRSRSDADIVKVPSELTFNKMPFKIGIVVLAVTAFETIFKALARFCWLQENFIKLPPVFYYYIIYVVIVVVGPVESVDNS